MDNPPFFILGSSSPRRVALLKQLGIVPDLVVSPDIDETPYKGEIPTHYVIRIATQKAESVATLHPNAAILAGDSVPVCGRRILQKANSPEEARRVMTLFSGRRHRFLSAISLYNPQTKGIKTRVVTTHVAMKHLTPQEIDLYIASHDWEGVAGYRLEGIAGSFIKSINGSFSNIIGLPLFETKNMLETVGIYPDINKCQSAASYN